MKIRPYLLKISLLYLLLIFILGSLVFFCFFSSFTKWPWEAFQWIVLSVFLLIAILGYIITLFKFYYIVESKYLAVIKLNKEQRYLYDEIVYIEDKGKKTSITFYTTKHGYIYLTGDKLGRLQEELLKRAKNATTNYQEFKVKYPNAK